MNPMKKVMVFSALIMAPLIIGLVIFLIHRAVDGNRKATFYETLNAKTPVTVAEVEKEMGAPLRIEHSQSVDQTVTGEVYHYPYHGDDMKVVFINGTVFQAEFVPGAKS